MSQDLQKFKVSCPSCAKQYLVPPEVLGKTLTCKACQKAFRLPAPPPSTPARPSAPPPTPKTQSTSRGNCGICQSEIEPNEPAKKCTGCSATYHADCWEYNKGCGMYGCSEAPPTEGLNSLEIPPSHWGQDNKKCPQCAQVILAAAVRCKHCGAVFESANPQDRGSFQAHEANRAKLPLIKTMAVFLLVVSLIPCTAPFAAIGGPIWYSMNRKSLALLPPFHAALCKIAVGVSITITVLLIACAVLYSLL